MKKRLLAALLALGILCGAAGAKQTQAAPALREAACALLMDAYGYTREEAQAFEITQWDSQGAVKLVCRPASHPDWRYTIQIGPGDEREAASPFDLPDAPEGDSVERVLREGVRLALRQWLPEWERDGRASMALWMWQNDIAATARLQEGIATGGLPAGNALHELLVSCCGQTFRWPVALVQWEKELLETQGLPLADPRVRGTVRFAMQTPLGQKVQVVRFEGELPDELRDVLSAPALAGWTPLCGCLLGYNGGEGWRTGLAALERDGRRLLVMFMRGSSQAQWQLFSLGEEALYANRDFYITAGSNGRMFEVVYPISATQRELFALYCQEDADLCRVDAYLKINDLGCDGAEVAYDADTGYTVTMTYADGRHQCREVQKAANAYLPGFRPEDYPQTLAECWQAPETLLPEGYGITQQVHLRAGCSTRSKDLGLYFPGTAVRILDVECGSAGSWYHVRAGSAEGYMSCDYVDDLRQQPCAVTGAVLPVGEALRDTALQSGMGWFAGQLQTLPAHTRFHVLAVCGEWLHVLLPQGELGWMMDINGLDGYIRAGDAAYISLTRLEEGDGR